MQGYKNALNFLTPDIAIQNLPNTFLQEFYKENGVNIIYSVTFVQKICVKALIYHSMFKNCFKRVQKSQNILFFAKPSY